MLEEKSTNTIEMINKYLQHIAEDAKDTVKSLVVLRSDTTARMSLPTNTSHEFSHETEVNDKWTGQQRVFTDVRHTFKTLVYTLTLK